jgi:IPT/TIG domain
MTVRGCAAATASLFGAALGCGTTSDPTVTVEKVSPEMAYNNAATTLQIGGGPFRPAYRFDTTAGTADTDAGGFSVTLTPVPASPSATPVSVQLTEVSWLTIKALVATLPAGVPAGVYDVAVTDPRGHRTDRRGGFTSLGPDEEPPIVTIESPKPGSLIGAETTVSVTIAADDGGAGRLESLQPTVTVMPAGISLDVNCPPVAGPKATCQFQFMAPAPTGDRDTIVIAAEAVDSAANWIATEPAVHRLARRPTLTAPPAPAIGPASGGTLIEVRGIDFLEPVVGSEGTALLIDGHPIPPETISPTRITARTPSHDPDIATITVSSGGAESLQMYYFQFVAGPIVREVVPASGPLSGGTWIKVVGKNFRNPQTLITVGGEALLCPYFEGTNRILGKTPAASAAGPVAVTATDDDGGSDTWLGVFTYKETDPPDDPTDCGGRP